jgi:hypothetical protein
MRGTEAMASNSCLVQVERWHGSREQRTSGQLAVEAA